MGRGTQLLRPVEVAAKLQLSPRTIYNWISSGRLTAYKVGRGWRIYLTDVESILGKSPSDENQTRAIVSPWERDFMSYPRAAADDNLVGQEEHLVKVGIQQLCKDAH